jgi:hypothetical protein
MDTNRTPRKAYTKPTAPKLIGSVAHAKNGPFAYPYTWDGVAGYNSAPG